MPSQKQSRRQFLQRTASATAASAAAAFTPYWLTANAARAQEESKNDRHVIGCIGTGDRWNGAIGPQVKKFGDIVAVCDVDKNHREKWGQKIAGEKADAYEDYRRVLDRKDIDVVTIVTPDHWHSKIAIEAMQAGKDVYCEKPLTLTIDEGKKICRVQKQTGRVFQVGTQQRDEFDTIRRPPPDAKKDDSKKDDAEKKPGFHYQFLQAVALAHAGKLGKIRQITCSIGDVKPCPALPKAPVPEGLNWELWQGQTPLVDYVQGGPSPSNPRYPAGRTHYEFRWWYEYSGGKLTDWGAHHVDIAQWAMGMDHTGPLSVEAVADLPVPFENGRPTVDNQYNTATKFNIACTYPNGAVLIIRDGPSNGIWIEGEKGEIFVSRGDLNDVRGNAIAILAEDPIPEDDLRKLCKGKEPGNHMRNFIECVRDRSEPISDVFTHHRTMTTCHLANIAIRLQRPIRWDADKEEIVGDSEANSWLSREQRKGYEINA
ncbi:MAG TPA: Gfo/Idh/MocA family oxidoreductase [Pirellulales bacterium]